MSEITVRGAHLHNLKNISLSIPKNSLVVFTGISGSGKSSLAFDTLYREGQRQYMESLGMVTYESPPAVDSITGLSPSISVDQRNSNRSPRSTVGTASEVYTYLRLLFARIGHRPCPNCGADIPPILASGENVGSAWEEQAGSAGQEEYVTCQSCGTRIPAMDMSFFSFNKPSGACQTCTGLGTLYSPILSRIIDEEKSLTDGAILVWDLRIVPYYIDILEAAGKYYGCKFDPTIPVSRYEPALRELLLYGAESASFSRYFPGVPAPKTVKSGRFEGVIPNLLRRYAEHTVDEDSDYRKKLEQLLVLDTCPACSGTRLRIEARQVMVAGVNIIALGKMPLAELEEWLAQLSERLAEDENHVLAVLLPALQERLHRLVEIGLGYLAFERSTPSLSAGEAQRLRLASLLGSGLTGVLYVLDEPTIGQHTRDNSRLVRMLRGLRDLGNTVLVIEHDLEVIARADWVVDFGPGGGQFGGEIVAQGTPETIARTPGSLTGEYLAGLQRVPLPGHRRPISGAGLTIHGARQHNLKDITVFFPAQVLAAVTGVSGSGKSTLVFDILDRAARQHFFKAAETAGAHQSIGGWEHFDRVITIDQAPLAISTRSNAATYTEAYTPIRELFASQPVSRQRGFTTRHFSFNVPGGRCERCEGAGTLSVEMQFLPDVQVRCPVCKGRRFQSELLEVKYRGLDIAQVLELTIAEALSVFMDVPAIKARLTLMMETGLGYLRMGQPASTFSGGEAQRVKLARELARRSSGRTLYLLDEPTTGLHPADITRLTTLLQQLVAAGNTVIVVEHNLDLVKCADWVIDLGPQGGINGGQVIAAGRPEEIAGNPNSITGQMLKNYLSLSGPSWVQQGA